jgi:CXXX repeat modification system protein
METKKLLGIITETETEDLRRLYERKLALHELIPSLDSGFLSNEQKDELYEKVLIDIEKTNSLFDSRRNEILLKNKWILTENGKWIIDFDTNEIFLLSN